MTKVRDIAAFLGKTEAFNTTNKRLAFDSNEISTLTPTIASDIINQYATVVYNTVDSLPANPIDGARAWVKANNRFYVADSSWHNTLLVNVPPTINIANYDSILSDSASITMTIQVTDSFENLDIITFGATLSPSNITDSAVLSFSRDSSVIALAINPDSANNATSFQITFTANDQINLASSVKSFTIDKGFVLELISQVADLSGGTIINIDSDVAGGEFQLTSGDVLSLEDGSLNATVSSAKFLDNTQQSRTFIGSLYGATVGNQGTGYFALQQDGTFNSTHIGKVVNFGSSETTAASRFRTGNASGGQTITGYTNQTHSVSTTTSSASSFSPFSLLGSPPTTNGGLVMYNVSIPAGYYSFNTDGSNQGYIASNRLYTSRQGKTLVWTTNISSGNYTYLSANVTYWNGRYNYMEYLDTSGSTYFRVQQNWTSFFTAGSQIWSTGNSGTGASRPSARDIVECNHLVVHSSSYNSGTNETTVYCGNQYGRQINQLHDTGFSYVTFTTGAVSPAKNIAFWKTTNLTSNITFFEGNSQSVGTSLDKGYQDTVNYSNYYLDREYGVRRSQGGVQTAVQVSMYTTTTTTTNTPYYRVQTQASPAGNGTNINLGTSSGSMYTWDKETSVTVDDNTGFTASDDIYLKT